MITRVLPRRFLCVLQGGGLLLVLLGIWWQDGVTGESVSTAGEGNSTGNQLSGAWRSGVVAELVPERAPAVRVPFDDLTENAPLNLNGPLTLTVEQPRSASWSSRSRRAPVPSQASQENGISPPMALFNVTRSSGATDRGDSSNRWPRGIIAVLAAAGWFLYRAFAPGRSNDRGHPPTPARGANSQGEVGTGEESKRFPSGAARQLSMGSCETMKEGPGESCRSPSSGAEERLREENRFLSSILDHIGDGVIAVATDGHFRLFNPRARALFGIGLDQACPDVWTEGWWLNYGVELWDPARGTTLPAAESPLARAARGESMDRQEIVLRRRDDSQETWLSITARPLEDAQGVAYGSVMAVRDISPRKEIEYRLRNSEALYHSMVENLPMQVLRKDLEGRFTFVNSPMAQLMQRPVEEIVGRTDFDFYPVHLAEKYQRDDRRVVESGEVLRDIEEHRTADGRTLTVEFLKTPVRNADGQLIGTQTIFMDVTARTEAERKLVESERLAAIGQMVAGVAHESRNALQQIQACCGLLEWKLHGNEDTRELLDDLQEAQDRLHRLFEDLRVYTGPVHLERRAADLGALLGDAWSALSHQRATRKLSYRQSILVDDLRCHVDPVQIKQALRNVLESSLAACADPIVLEVSCNETLLEGQRAFRLAITDNGPCLNDSQREMLFKPFHTRLRGSGLSLAVAKRIVEAHGGRISADPQGKGGIEIVLPRGTS